MEILPKLKENLIELFENLDLQKELYLKLYEAALIKDYLNKNPEEKSVVVISYQDKKVDRFKTYLITNEKEKIRKVLGSAWKYKDLSSHKVSFKDEKTLTKEVLPSYFLKE